MSLRDINNMAWAADGAKLHTNYMSVDEPVDESMEMSMEASRVFLMHSKKFISQKR